MHQPNPDGLFHEIVTDTTHEYCSSGTPISDTSIETVVEEYQGEDSSVEVEAPDGTTHCISGTGAVPNKETLIEQLDTAATELNPYAVNTVTDLRGVHLGPLHYTDQTVHFVVEDDPSDRNPQRGDGGLPDLFEKLGVKLAHTIEGFHIAEHKPYHWKRDLPWSITSAESETAFSQGGLDLPGDFSSVPVSHCWVINVEALFPAQSLGQAMNPPASTVTAALKQTEHVFDETLLTRRQAQYSVLDDLELSLTDPRHQFDESRDMEFDEIVKATFHLSDSGLRSLTSTIDSRRRAAFQTVRRLSESDEFNYIMAEHAETIDQLATLAGLGLDYQRENGDPMGFY